VSRNIPRVRRWRVRFYMGHTLLADMVVDAPTKLFARWASRDHIIREHLDRYLATDKITVSPMAINATFED
jgi:hypothetical protein